MQIEDADIKRNIKLDVITARIVRPRQTRLYKLRRAIRNCNTSTPGPDAVTALIMDHVETIDKNNNQP